MLPEGDDENFDENQEIDENEEGGDPMDDVFRGINFEVVISKSTGDLVVECTAGKTLSINEVQFFPQGKNKEDEDVYGGPVFGDLDESLQESMYSYLEERGVDDDLCYFVILSSRHKEQQEYMNWLNNLLNFVEK